MYVWNALIVTNNHLCTYHFNVETYDIKSATETKTIYCLSIFQCVTIITMALTVQTPAEIVQAARVSHGQENVPGAAVPGIKRQGVRQGINHLCVKNVSYSMRSLHN